MGSVLPGEANCCGWQFGLIISGYQLDKENLEHFAWDVGVMFETVSLDHEVTHVREGCMGPP